MYDCEWASVARTEKWGVQNSNPWCECDSGKDGWGPETAMGPSAILSPGLALSSVLPFSRMHGTFLPFWPGLSMFFLPRDLSWPLE